MVDFLGIQIVIGTSLACLYLTYTAGVLHLLIFYDIVVFSCVHLDAKDRLLELFSCPGFVSDSMMKRS